MGWAVGPGPAQLPLGTGRPPDDRRHSGRARSPARGRLTMLDPEGRHLLLDALRPPPGHELDLAVGTTYTLDLYALLSAPVAFAMFDREAEDGTPRLDPIAALQALRRYAGRITMFC